MVVYCRTILKIISMALVSGGGFGGGGGGGGARGKRPLESASGGREKMRT